MRLVVTGGLGFIGSNFVRYYLQKYPSCRIVNIDKQTYAGNPENLKDVASSPLYSWVKADILDVKAVEKALKGAECVVHFAAETHVDRSILGSGDFLRTNILGTHVLLESARRLGIKRFMHVSTDEVYGSVPEGFSREGDVLLPRSPYAASKAAADHIVMSYFATYDLPVIITRSSNNFGPYQFPEKMIPLLITNALDDKPFPLYGDGLQVRDWLYVIDHVRAIDLLLEKGVLGEVYNIGGTYSTTNLDLAGKILVAMGKPPDLIKRVPDRPGHDRRYALNCDKLKNLGWRPETSFEDALKKTVKWFVENRAWWEKLKKRREFSDYYKRQYRERLSKAGDVAPGKFKNPGGVPGEVRRK